MTPLWPCRPHDPCFFHGGCFLQEPQNVKKCFVAHQGLQKNGPGDRPNPPREVGHQPRIASLMVGKYSGIAKARLLVCLDLADISCLVTIPLRDFGNAFPLVVVCRLQEMAEAPFRAATMLFGRYPGYPTSKCGEEPGSRPRFLNRRDGAFCHGQIVTVRGQNRYGLVMPMYLGRLFRGRSSLQVAR